MTEISNNKFYEEYGTNGLGDVYTFGEVMNYHFASSKWVNGVAFIEMAHDIYGIFDGWNQKFYLFNKVNTPMDWIKRQFVNCYSKYSDKSEYAKKQIADINEYSVKKVIEAQRAMDY